MGTRIDLFSLWGAFALGILVVLLLQATRFLRSPASGSGLYSFIAPLFLIIALTNLAGLTPFTFAFRRQFWFCATLSVTFWVSLTVSDILKAPARYFGRLAPGGCPSLLVPFLVLIETVRSLIRPLTLGVRLIANISAGHIIIGLLRTIIASAGVFGFGLSVFYSTFEVFVACIQAYIFTLLLRMYLL